MYDAQSTIGLKEERNVLDELLGIQEDDLENDLDIGSDLPGKLTLNLRLFILTFLIDRIVIRPPLTLFSCSQKTINRRCGERSTGQATGRR